MSRLPVSSALRWRAVILTILAIALIEELTLRPVYGPLIGPVQSFFCLFDCGNESLRDFFSNILLFMPLGWALSYWLRPRAVLGLSLIVTTAIEALQFSLISGRDSSLRDILSNGIGAAVGTWLFHHWPRLRFPEPPRALRLGWGAALLWVLGLTVAAVGTRVAPSTRPWFGSWTPERGGLVPFTGQLLAVDLDGVTPDNGTIADPAPLRASLRRDSFNLSLRLVWGRPVRGLASIFDLLDERGTEQLFLGQRHQMLWFRVRRNFDRWELRGLTIRLPRDPRWKVGDTITVTAGLSRRALYLRASGPGDAYGVEVPQTVGIAWNSMAPWLQPNANQWYFNAAWMALLGLPVGYWFGRWSPGPGLLAALAVMTTGLIVAPLLGGAGATLRAEWIGSAAGVLTGWLDGIISRRNRQVTPGETG